MTPLAVLSSDIKATDMAALVQCVELLKELPDTFSCHQVCERLAPQILGARWVKGKFNHYDHSWLELASGNILDPYPWACGSGPLLVVSWAVMWATLYKETD